MDEVKKKIQQNKSNIFENNVTFDIMLVTLNYNKIGKLRIAINEQMSK